MHKIILSCEERHNLDPMSPEKGCKGEGVWDRGGDARDSILMTQLHIDPGCVSDWMLRSFEFSRESGNKSEALHESVWSNVFSMHF